MFSVGLVRLLALREGVKSQDCFSSLRVEKAHPSTNRGPTIAQTSKESPSTMESIVERLLNDTAEVYQQAFEDCRGIEDSELIDELAEKIRSRDISEPVRQRLAKGLGRISGDQSEALLFGLCQEDDPNMRGMGCVGLAERAEAEPVSRLIEALADDVNTVRNLAERGLIGLIETVPEFAVPELLELLHNPVPLTRSPAARLLGQTGDVRALEPLQKLLKDDEWLTRMWACHALGDLGHTAACDGITERARTDPKNRVRAAAVEALGKLRCPDSEETIRAALDDQDAGVKNSADDALRAMGLSDAGEEFNLDDYD